MTAVSVNFKEYMKRIGVNVWSWKLSRKQHCWGQQRYCPCKKKEKRDLGPMETCCYPLPRTINQAEHPSWVYHNHNHNHNHIHNHNNNNSNIAKNLKQHLETIGVTIKDELLQKVALLGMESLLGKVFETWGCRLQRAFGISNFTNSHLFGELDNDNYHFRF